MSAKFWSELPPNPRWKTPCPPPEFDMFAPPKRPVPVHCWHCGKRYRSDKMAWGRKVGMIAGISEDEPLWWCPTPKCDGAGFRHDIWPDSEDDAHLNSSTQEAGT